MYEKKLMKEALMEIAPLLRATRDWNLNREEYKKKYTLHENAPYVKMSLEIWDTLQKYETLTEDKYFFWNKKLVWEVLKENGLQRLSPVLDRYIHCGVKDPAKKNIGWAILKYVIGLVFGVIALHTMDLSFWKGILVCWLIMIANELCKIPTKTSA